MTVLNTLAEMPVSQFANRSRRRTMKADSLLTVAVIGLMVLIWAALLWFPVLRITGDAQVNYNEGWNAYKQSAVANGLPLYGNPPDVLSGATTYPPVSFHLIGWLGLNSLYVTAGRWVSLCSLILTGMFVGLIVNRYAASLSISLFSSLFYVIGIAVLFPSRLGMNDPQLLGEALTTAGLYCYVRNNDSKRMLCVSALLFCLAGFTKQNLVAFPAAVAIDLLLRSRKMFAGWMGWMALLGGSFVATSMLIDGRYFLLHLFFPRAYSLRDGWHTNTHPYFVMFAALLFVTTLWTIVAFRSRVLLVSAFILSHALAFCLAGGDGVDVNIYFNALAAAVILCGAALSDVATVARNVALHFSQPGPTAAVMLALFASIVIHVPGQLQDNYANSKLLTIQNAEFLSATQFVRARPGPALCESLLLCYQAGKPYQFDPLVIRDQIKIGKLDEREVLRLLETHQLQIVQLTVSPEDAKASPESLVKERSRFTGKFMQQLVDNYRIALRTSQLLIFVPDNNRTKRGTSQDE